MRPNLITRLKEEWNNLDPVDPLRGLIADAIDALAEQPANQVDDINVADIPKIGCANHDCDKCKAQQQEPVAWKTDDVELYVREDKFGFYNIPLYTHPPRKPWVGLTDEERDAILDREFKQWWSRHDAVCRAIEAKLREKNA